jgi:hypothetical protein
LLIITCDEHGGCYDHVPPPPAASPETPLPNQTFGFDRYGVRVPAVYPSGGGRESYQPAALCFLRIASWNLVNKTPFKTAITRLPDIHFC